MLNNYERLKLKKLELSGDLNYWTKGTNNNVKLKKYEPNKNRVSIKIRDIRGNRTLKEFGELIGVSISSISNYENAIALPRDRVIKNIIELKESNGMTFHELLYGFPLEYLEDIFGGIRDLEAGNRSEFYEIMEEFLIENKAYYTYEDSLISKAIEFFPSLKNSPDFIVLARLYGIEKQNVHLLNFNVNKFEQSKDSNYRYEIEMLEDFHTLILPMLNEEIDEKDDLKEIASHIKNTIKWIKFEKQNEQK